MVLSNDDVMTIIKLLSKEQPMVEYTQNDDTKYPGKLPRAPYGYYEIKNCSYGPIFIKICCPDKMKENVSPCVHLQTIKGDAYIYKSITKGLYIDTLRAIHKLHRKDSNLTTNEATLRCFHFLDSDDNKKRINEHYLNARVMYDTMHEMMGVKCSFILRNDGYVIKALFGNGDIETIGIKQTQEYNTCNVPYPVMNIIIPSVDLHDKFDDYTDSTEMMVFRKAKEFINRAHNPQGGRAISESETFTRWDNAYINLMAEIKKRRGKAK